MMTAFSVAVILLIVVYCALITSVTVVDAKNTKNICNKNAINASLAFYAQL